MIKAVNQVLGSISFGEVEGLSNKIGKSKFV